MRVGLLTSWRVPCGIYQYTSRLAEALNRREDAEVVILAGRADEHRSVPEESDLEVHDVATIGLWRDDGVYHLDIPAIDALGLDALHVQYQSMLFQQPPLMSLANAFGGVKAITFHDNCVLASFPAALFDLRFAHRHGVGMGAQPIPFGIEDRPPIIRTFGLGRSRSDLIAEVCAGRGWIFETAASHEPIHGGGQSWRSHRELVEWLRGADAIVLWYDDNAAAGSSQAARTAMASRRPVLTNDTTWFSDLPERADGYWKIHSTEELGRTLEAILHRDYTAANSWDRIAELLVTCYRGAGVREAA